MKDAYGRIITPGARVRQINADNPEQGALRRNRLVLGTVKFVGVTRVLVQFRTQEATDDWTSITPQYLELLSTEEIAVTEDPHYPTVEQARIILTANTYVDSRRMMRRMLRKLALGDLRPVAEPDELDAFYDQYSNNEMLPAEYVKFIKLWAAGEQGEAQEQPTEGWGVIRPGNRVAHYYRATFSLCGKVGLYAGPLDPDDKPSPDDCTPCRRMLNGEKKGQK